MKQKLRKKARMMPLTSAFHHWTRCLSYWNTVKIGDKKGEDIRLSFFTDSMIIFVENLEEITKKFLELINNYNNTVVYKINTQKPIPFLYSKKLWNQSHNQFSSVAQLCLTLCDPIACSMPGFPVHHQLPELAQTHVHQVSDVIQPSHPVSSPSPPAFNLSQHQSLFQWVTPSQQVAKALEFQLQHQSFQWIFRTDFL